MFSLIKNNSPGLCLGVNKIIAFEKSVALNPVYVVKLDYVAAEINLNQTSHSLDIIKFILLNKYFL